MTIAEMIGFDGIQPAHWDVGLDSYHASDTLTCSERRFIKALAIKQINYESNACKRAE